MRYAAYGSNLHPMRLTARVRSAELLGTGTLDDWSLGFNKLGQDGSGKCTVLPGRGGVQVAVYEVSAAEMNDLDRIEGVGRGYTRETLAIPGFGSSAIYVGSEGYLDERLKPFCWYRELVLLGARLHNFSEDYVSMIDRVEAHTDPDPDRRAEHWALIEAANAATP